MHFPAFLKSSSHKSPQKDDSSPHQHAARKKTFFFGHRRPKSVAEPIISTAVIRYQDARGRVKTLPVRYHDPGITFLTPRNEARLRLNAKMMFRDNTQEVSVRKYVTVKNIVGAFFRDSGGVLCLRGDGKMAGNVCSCRLKLTSAW